MEGMSKSHHDLTDADMKSITFQVIPQFYWKYEWSYNEFMIHPVGKLQTPSEDIAMYDMLGNVWEWVRDDWTANVSALNGTVNPIAGTKAGSHEKVIKGGAFDQLVRKVTSSSREELGWDKFQSRYNVHANVGFRPSMVYTQEISPSGSQGFGSGENTAPVDLFFLFDASASQDNQVKEMLKSAQEIVGQFAGGPDNRDVCHVGSALFLGPDIRLMCAHKCT